jgi:hypothetical protein
VKFSLAYALGISDKFESQKVPLSLAEYAVSAKAGLQTFPQLRSYVRINRTGAESMDWLELIWNIASVWALCAGFLTIFVAVFKV